MQVGRKQAATERSRRKGAREEGERDGGLGVRQFGGVHAGRGLSQAQPMGCCLPAKPSLLSGIESLSLPLNQTGGVDN